MAHEYTEKFFSPGCRSLAVNVGKNYKYKTF